MFLEKHHQAGPNIFDEATVSYLSAYAQAHPGPRPPPPPPPPPVGNITSMVYPSSQIQPNAELWDSLSFLSGPRGKVRETAEVPHPDVSGLPPDAVFTYNKFPKLNPELFPLNPTPPKPLSASSASLNKLKSSSSAPPPIKLYDEPQKTDGTFCISI